MPRPDFRFTLSKLMKIIGGVALLLTLIRWNYGWLFVAPGVLIGSAILLAGTGWVTGLRATVCVITVYPWLMISSLYLAFGSAWLILGHQPVGSAQPSLGSWVNFFGGTTGLLLIGLPVAMVVGMLLTVSDLILTVEANRPNRPAEVSWLFLGPILLWLGAFFVLVLDPGNAFVWLMGD